MAEQNSHPKSYFSCFTSFPSCPWLKLKTHTDKYISINGGGAYITPSGGSYLFINCNFTDVRHSWITCLPLQMQKEQRDNIRKNWVRLVEETPFSLVLNYLYQEKIFKKTIVEDILFKTPSERSWAFLDALQRSGPSAYTEFVLALQKCGRQDLADLL